MNNRIDAKIKQEFRQKHKQRLMNDALKIAFTESKVHTVEDIAHIVFELLDGVYEDLLHVNVDEALENASLEYLRNNIEKLFPSERKTYYCRNCGQTLNEIKYVTTPQITWEVTCFLLCNDCIHEFVCHARGETAKCEICGTYHNPFPKERDEHLAKYYSKLCQQCFKIPHIMDEIDTLKTHNDRAVHAGNLGRLTLKQWRQTLDFFERKCAYCDGLHTIIEHYIPINKGGNTEQSNCFPACQKCNAKKGSKLPEQFERLFPTANIQRIKEYQHSIANQGVKLG